MTTLHQLLARQLERLGIDAEVLPSPASWRALLETVSQTYTEAAQERFTMEHSLASTSSELRQLYDDLKHSSEAELAGERDKLSKSVAIHEATLEASPDGVLIVGEDRGRHAEARTQEMKEAAERANRAKGDFLRNMSHEMRTPLNAILGFARVLRRSAGAVLNEDQQGYLQDIVQAGGYMLQLVNDLLDLRSLEETTLQLAPLVLEPLIAQSVSMVRPLVHEKHLDLQLTLATGLPRVLADRRAVVQILVNLLSNAGKFTPAGGSISVTAATSGPWVEVAVTDTGSGIAPEHQERLFEYFEQLGGKGAAHMKGSGVGLALTRSLIEKQGGTISVESALGRGSTFRFRLEAVR